MCTRLSTLQQRPRWRYCLPQHKSHVSGSSDGFNSYMKRGCISTPKCIFRGGGRREGGSMLLKLTDVAIIPQKVDFPHALKYEKSTLLSSYGQIQQFGVTWKPLKIDSLGWSYTNVITPLLEIKYNISDVSVHY